MKSRFFIFAIVLCASYASGAFHARAATFHFESEGSTVGVGQPFKLALLVDATKPVNAFDVTLTLPPGVAVTV